MPTADGSLTNTIGILLVFVLVAANGFFVAAEFSLVAVRRSRVAQLVEAGRANAKTLERAVDNLDSYLAATQLGITISSLALGWIGEPALARVIEPFLSGLLGAFAAVGAHAIAVAIAFIIITALHIVLGELAPKSLALQRSEATALRVVRPLGIFLFLLRPAIVTLNGLGNLVLRLCGLRPGNVEESLHSPEELKLLIAASQEGGLLQEAQQEVVERVLNIGDRRISDIMTPRVDVDWIDINDNREEILRSIRECRHGQLLVGKGSIDEPLGMILKRDLLDLVLDGQPPDPMTVIRQPLAIHEGMRFFKVLEQFKRAPVRLAMILNEYGVLEGIVTQTDLLEAIAGDLVQIEGEEPEVVEREDGSLLIDGMMSAQEAFDWLNLRTRPADGGFHTIAGFMLRQLGHLPKVGEHFDYEGWRFEVVDLDGRRIDKVLAIPPKAEGDDPR
ncbi:MAG: hemolysin family protein [Methyloceanibacter sp.]